MDVQYFNCVGLISIHLTLKHHIVHLKNVLHIVCHSSVGKEFACNAGDLSSIPGSGRSPGEGNGNQLQYSCLEKPMDRGVWQATVHGVAKNRTERLSRHAHPSEPEDAGGTALYPSR